ncbi:DnaJ chaperone protein [Trypanosoma rangeli]|uniref:DnaJ chaperone protein n=1 Tax=Trypanosoma rangeli TaxID=5698 RepID=A0A3R7P4U9_TRYRA|nr:DnaJ chaperone protein [Trypanosoma rangeli]RNF12762.1 DnaJ chaperone protein [Trypanosoma rangeli]|eukprot:RNF12762.1 DnaJ chaperone protein [Trypanosoma rangeli]
MRCGVYDRTFCGALRYTRLSLPQRCWCSAPYGTLHVVVRFVSNSSIPIANCYRRLGVDCTATTEEMKAAYRRRALECHPDVVSDDQKAQAEVEFRAVSEAYDVLMDPHKRAEHDKALGLDRVAASRATSPQRDTTASPSPASSRAASTRRQKPFVRGDADRKFREAFHGMSIDQVIFQERLRQRQEKRKLHEATASSSSYEESLRRVIVDAAERFHEKVQRQYGPSMLRHVKLQTELPNGPQPPPSDYMPFRPFHGWSVPEGVRTVPEPRMGPISHVSEENVKFEGPPTPMRRDLPKYFPTVKALDGSVMGRGEALQHLERERNAPYNMGKLYSYHRPY